MSVWGKVVSKNVVPVSGVVSFVDATVPDESSGLHRVLFFGLVGQIEELFRHLEGAVEHRLRNLVVHHLIHGRSKKRMLATDYSLIDAVGLLH